MSEYMSAKRFAEKAEWEGGFFEALDYGLRAAHLDPTDKDSVGLRAAWSDLEDAYAGIRVLVCNVEDEISKLGDDEDE